MIMPKSWPYWGPPPRYQRKRHEDVQAEEEKAEEYSDPSSQNINRRTSWRLKYLLYRSLGLKYRKGGPNED